MLLAEYEKVELCECEHHYAQMVLPIHEYGSEVYIYNYTTKENADLLLKDLFTYLHKIDDAVLVGRGGCSIEDPLYEIAFFEVYDNKVGASYFGISCDTIDIEVYIEPGEWYYISYRGGNATDATITDISLFPILANLNDLKNLKGLTLACKEIDDLSPLKNLKHLNLYGNLLEDKDIAKLKSLNSNIKDHSL